MEGALRPTTNGRRARRIGLKPRPAMRKRPPGSSFDPGDRLAYFTANSVRFMKILNA